MSGDPFDLKGEPTSALALAAGATIVAAADAAGINERTVRRRLEDPRYRAVVHQLRSRHLEETLGILADAGTTAARTLAELCRDAPPSVRLGAAKAILDQSVNLSENLATEERIATLERLRFMEFHNETTFDPKALTDGP